MAHLAGWQMSQVKPVANARDTPTHFALILVKLPILVNLVFMTRRCEDCFASLRMLFFILSIANDMTLC